ncbi:MAG: class II aldolase [Gammaproteobacteria bacterium]|nr:class II aldolase [Gammaproteobacteria bacterium]
MNDSENELRQQIVDHAKRFSLKNLTAGKSGNISVRFGNTCLITPSAVEYESLTIEDIVLIDFSGQIIRGYHQPSSEWHFHCGIYKSRADVESVVHTHSTYCTALACAHEKIPAFHYMVAIAGGNDIPLVPYQLFGTKELSSAVIDRLSQRNACLLANHGLVAVGKDLKNSFNLAMEVEQLAEQYCTVKKIGEAQLLNDDEMELVIEKFKHYGER